MANGYDPRGRTTNSASFKCLISNVAETLGMATSFKQRVSAAWRNWKRCSEVLCDKRMPVKLKGNVYKVWSVQLCRMVQIPVQ